MKESYVVKISDSRVPLDELLKKISKINKKTNHTVQIFDPNYVISKLHLAASYKNSIKAFRSKANISNSISMEMMLFAAMTRQINGAIKKLGAKSNKRFALFANSNKAYSMIKDSVDSKEFKISKKDSERIARKFGINQKDNIDLFMLQKMAISRLE